MRRLILVSFLALPLAACQSSRSGYQQAPQPVALSIPTGAQSVQIAASPETVKQILVSGAQQRGTPIIQDQPNMVVLERTVTEANPSLDAEFGPSDNGQRKFRIRVRFQGTACDTFVVQDVSVINNAGTALEQSFSLTQPQYNNPDSLRGLKRNAETMSGCA